MINDFWLLQGHVHEPQIIFVLLMHGLSPIKAVRCALHVPQSLKQVRPGLIILILAIGLTEALIGHQVLVISASVRLWSHALIVRPRRFTFGISRGSDHLVLEVARVKVLYRRLHSHAAAADTCIVLITTIFSIVRIRNIGKILTSCVEMRR